VHGQLALRGGLPDLGFFVCNYEPPGNYGGQKPY